MKRTGTLKAEIIKPLDRGWDEVGGRLRALSFALAPALNSTMRELYPGAIAQIDDKRSGKKPDTSWQAKARATLRQKWTSELAKRLDYAQSQFKKGKLKHEPDSLSCVPVVSGMVGETVNLLLLSRFTGEHLKALLSAQSSIPSWSGQQAFYTEGRECSIEGPASDAKLRFPLWGAGKKSVTLAVAPAGNAHRAMWRRMVRDFARRSDVVDLEKIANKKPPAKPKNFDELPKMEQKRIEAERAKVSTEQQRALHSLEEMRVMKMGRVGIRFKRGKWYVLISWTEYLPEIKAGDGQVAAVNYGVNVFAQALAEDGTTWDDPGGDIRVTRERFARRRYSIQRSLRRLGHGSRGHGKQRRYLPITKIEKREQAWVETRIRQHAADLISWCVDHRVTKLVLHDMSGMRETFEKKTEGNAHEQLKRFIHSWPFYETRVAVERQAAEFGIEVQAIKPGKESIKCPECDHTHIDNIALVDRGGEFITLFYRNGEYSSSAPRPSRKNPKPHAEARVYRSVEKFTRFLCVQCETKGKGDQVTCANMLVAVGANNPLGKAQEKARKRTAAAIKTVKSTVR